MTTRHTPGPWEYFEHGTPPQGGPAFVDICSPSGRSVARTMKGAISHDGGDMVANARLIAAAPDLLAACKAAQVLGTLAETHTPAQVSAMLDEAIARAEGK